MKKTKTQRDYQRQMAELRGDSDNDLPMSKPSKKRFRDTKLFYYGIRIILIIIVLQIVGAFDTAIYNIINMYR